MYEYIKYKTRDGVRDPGHKKRVLKNIYPTSLVEAMSPQLEREGEKDILLHKDENVRRKVGQTFQIWRRNLCETYIPPNGLVATQTHTGEEILQTRLRAVKTKN